VKNRKEGKNASKEGNTENRRKTRRGLKNSYQCSLWMNTLLKGKWEERGRKIRMNGCSSNEAQLIPELL